MANTLANPLCPGSLPYRSEVLSQALGTAAAGPTCADGWRHNEGRVQVL